MIWSAPAERSGDGALDLRPSFPTPSKAVSRCACHRAPNWRRDMTTIRKIIGTAFLVFAICICVSAQQAQRKPSESTRPFVVMSSQSLNDLEKTLKPENKTSELIDSAGMQLRVAVQHEKNKTGAA